MRAKKTTLQPSSLGVEHKILESFKDDLKNQATPPLNLAKCVEEIPQELHSGLVPRILAAYFDHCVAQGWTISKEQLIQQLPDYRDVIDQVYRREFPNDVDVEPATVSTRSLETTAVYAVSQHPWKEGGQGTLHKSNEAAIGNRQVLVKFLNDPSRKHDFQKEVEVTAKLEHPGVVAVYTQGVEQDQHPFFAMRLIHGETLERRISDFHHRLAAQSHRQSKQEWSRSGGIVELIEHIISAANTVSHAQSVGVLHCDLKPRNIMCGRFGATIVLDWGSATNCDVPEDHDRDSAPPIDLPSRTTCDITLAYASPEQIALAYQETTETRLAAQSDVFSLGATLYQALTGTPPFDSRRTKDSTAESPREKNPEIPKKLSAICSKAMQLAPHKRYGSMVEFADDLRNWLRDEPLRAMPDNPADRFFRFARRHKGASLASLILFVVLVLGLLVGSNFIKKHHETLNNLDLTLALIEDVCEPLARDEVQNLKEFEQIADQVSHTFTEDYLAQNKGGDEKTLARIYNIKAIIEFYRYTRQPADSTAGTNTENPRHHLEKALDFLQKAEALYGESDVFTKAENQLRQARWSWQLANTETRANAPVKDRSSVLTQLDQVIQTLHAQTSSDRQEQLLAEACHLKGEYLNNNRQNFKAMNYDSVSDLLTDSLTSFDNAIDHLKDLSDTLGTMDTSRDLARAYGYRGDLYRSRGEVEKALEDYLHSLKKRERMVKGLGNHVESNFQLARGYTNFGTLARDFGSQISEDELFANRPKHPGTPIEFQIAEAYVLKALKIQKAFQGLGDKRFVSDLTWSSNVAAELYLFAAESEGLSSTQKTEYLEKAEDIVDEVIQSVTGQPAEELLGGAEIAHPPWAPDRGTLALSLMLKMRIGRAREEVATGVAPASVRDLIPLTNGFAALDETELVAYFVASMAEEGGTHVREIVQQFQERRFNKLDRLRKHLQGLGLEAERIETLLSPLSEQIDG